MTVHLPPPLLAAGAAVAQRLVSRGAQPTATSNGVAASVLLGSAALAVAAVGRFRSSSTTIDPVHLDRVTNLVTTGPNAITRNPMYVGLAGTLVAHAIARRSCVALVPVAAFVAVMNATQIRQEEALLRARFGQAYADYCARVPRWLGPTGDSSD